MPSAAAADWLPILTALLPLPAVLTDAKSTYALWQDLYVHSPCDCYWCQEELSVHRRHHNDLSSPVAAHSLSSDSMASSRSAQPSDITFDVPNTTDGPKSEQEIGFVDEEAPLVRL